MTLYNLSGNAIVTLMQRPKRYYVYIMSSKGRILYIGVTGFLMSRTLQHKAGDSSFTSRYQIDRLVYYETFKYVNKAIARETEIKKWRREKKVSLIESMNPAWEDLSVGWGPVYSSGNSRFLLVAALLLGMTNRELFQPQRSQRELIRGSLTVLLHHNPKPTRVIPHSPSHSMLLQRLAEI
jgi:putative endonuclease